MKNKFWILMAIAAMVLMSCDTDSKEQGPTYTPSNHLGIGETCSNSTACGFKSYGTVKGVDINRVGPVNDTTFTDDKIAAVAQSVISAYGAITDQKDLARIESNVIQIINSMDPHTYNEFQKTLKITMKGDVPAWLKGKAHPKSAHRGIGETCLGGDECGFQDYRTANMANSAHADYFQWPIHRVGAESNYGTNGAELTTTVGNILAGYKGLESVAELPNLKKSSLEQVHITHNAPSGPLEVVFGKYTWDGTILGIQKGNASNPIKECMIDISNNALLYAQLQQALNRVIFMAGNKNAKQVIAGGADKDPKVNTVAQNFRLNRQAIARNNRNVKPMLRQAQA